MRMCKALRGWEREPALGVLSTDGRIPECVVRQEGGDRSV